MADSSFYVMFFLKSSSQYTCREEEPRALMKPEQWSFQPLVWTGAAQQGPVPSWRQNNDHDSVTVAACLVERSCWMSTSAPGKTGPLKFNPHPTPSEPLRITRPDGVWQEDLVSAHRAQQRLYLQRKINTLSLTSRYREPSVSPNSSKPKCLSTTEKRPVTSNLSWAVNHRLLAY